MRLIDSNYGKGRVRVLRLRRDDTEHSLSELAVRVALHGDFQRVYTDADNTGAVATDSMRNIINVVAREELEAEPEAFAMALARRLLDTYGNVAGVRVMTAETRWARMQVAGAAHPHGFVLDANGQPTVQLECRRAGEGFDTVLRSGIDGFTFMKTTQSGWADFLMDRYTTLRATDDRIAATSMNASWSWRTPADAASSANARVLQAMLEVFATTYSHSLQDSMYRMGEAALAVVPEIAEISLACPNKHYLPIDLAPFGMSADDRVFTPTDEPHGQIECVVGR